MNIVLAHGILGFSKFGGISYFNGIENHLKKQHNAKVLAPAVNPTASIKDRGEELKQEILKALKNNTLNPRNKTHIIAHSMGGLDSRYILSPQNSNNIAGLISSLTTIGTPHNGSPLADKLFPLLDGKSISPAASLIERLAIKILFGLGISPDGLHDLTTTAMHNFNQVYNDNPDISYFCVAGTGRNNGEKKTTSLFFEQLHKLIKGISGEENDGAVTKSSAYARGEIIGDEWPADHMDEVGHDLDKLPNGEPDGFEYRDKYDEIIKRISS